MTNLTARLMDVYARAEECEPGSAWLLAFLLYYRQRSQRRVLCVGRCINGGPVQIDAALTPEDEFQFSVVDNEKLSKPGLDADPDYLEKE